MKKLPLLAVRRIRTGSGAVVLPGNPIPGSSEWSVEVRKRRIKTGFAIEQPDNKKPKAKSRKDSKTKAETKE